MNRFVGTLLVIAALLLALAPPASAQQMAWQQIYSRQPYYVYLYDVRQTGDGGYILCGYTYSPGTGDDVLLIKTDASGSQQWQKIIGTSDLERGYCIIQAADGGYVICGDIYLYGKASYDVLIMKTDGSGNLLWQKAIGSPVAAVNEQAFSIEETTDGGYILCGQGGAPATDAFLLKTDSAGEMQWMRTYGGSDYDHGRAVHQTADGGYVFAGHYYPPYTSGYDAWLVKTDANGNVLWDKKYGGTGYQYIESMQITADGGFILAGYSYVSLATRYDVLLIKTDANGNQQWYQTLGGTADEYGYTIEPTSDAGYILGGYRRVNYGPSDALLIKVDSGGVEQWQQTYGGPDYEYCRKVRQTSDGGLIAAGYIYQIGVPYRGWLMKAGGSVNQPPVADAGSDQNLAVGAGCTVSALLDGSNSSDPDSTPGTNDDIAAFDWYEGATLLGSSESLSYQFSVGSHTVTLVVTDQAGEASSDDTIINAADVSAPAISAPADVVVECTGPGGQAVDIGVAAASDNCCDATIENDAPALFSLGSASVTWKATDCSGNVSTAVQTVTVQDTIPPELSVSVSPDRLWPPNHQMIPITPTITASDVCCSNVQVELVSVRMNEGDGENTFDPNFDINPDTGFIGNDIQIIGGQISFRAERSGNGGGRIYTLTYKATDCAGDSSTAEATVTVPHAAN